MIKEVRMNEQRRALEPLHAREPLMELMKFSIDSVYENAFRVEISKLVIKPVFDWSELDLAKFEFWEPLETGSYENLVNELPFEIPYERVREGMVFVVGEERVVEITDLVHEESKKLYAQMLVREHNVRIRRLRE